MGYKALMNVPILDAVKSQLAKLRPSDFVALAKATGVPEGTIRKIHYGEVSDPRIGTVQKLHDYFVGPPPRATRRRAA
jgi:predicted transcriptional regulator